MKKIIYLAAFLMGLVLFPSCQKEEMVQKEATASFQISIPQEVVTKAYGDGKFDAKNVIIGIFDENGIEKTRTVLNWGKDEFKKDVQITFVIGASYQMVFWAQYGDAYGKCESMKLDKITMPYEKSNQENLDAFYAYVPVFKVTGDFNKEVEMKRPFAQVNFATTPGDIDEAIKAGLDPKAEVTLSNVAKTLNLFTGETSDYGKVTVPATEIAKDANGKYYQIEVEGKNYDVVAMNYFLVADKETTDGKTTSDMNLKVDEVDLTVPGANMKRNFRTNIVGELLTGEGKFTISIDPIFTSAYNEDITDHI